MAKKKSLMDALNEYQEGNEYGKAQRKEEREKKQGTRAAKAKVDTKRAFSTKSLLKTEKVKPVKKKEEKKDPPKQRKDPPTTQRKNPPTTQRKDPPKSPARTLYEGGNVGTGRDGRFGTGTFGRGRPTEGKEVEKKNRRGRVSGTQRQLPKKEEKKMTAAERRRMRLRARRGR